MTIKTTITAIAMTTLMLTGCSQTSEQPDQATTADQTLTELIMSRRSTISRETLDAILDCGINAPNGKNLQSYEIRVLSPALIDSITQAVVSDNPKIGEREGFKNIFVNAPCVICIANDTRYDMSQIDCGLLGQNIILSAVSAVRPDGCSTRHRPNPSSTAWISRKVTSCSTASHSAIPTRPHRPNPAAQT